MRIVALFSVLLMLGMLGSQFLPLTPEPIHAQAGLIIQLLTMIGLAFIMIHVGYEFELDKTNLRQYGWDAVVAATAASLPWLFASLYLVFAMLPSDTWGGLRAWQEGVLVGLFAAPTSAGLLFAMLAAAGLSGTWLFRKARVLAIFDDLDTVLLLIPLKILLVGWSVGLAASVILMLLLLWLAYQFLHRWAIPVTWCWVLSYAVLTALVCEAAYLGSQWLLQEPVHVEVLLPAFVLGCLMRWPTGANPHGDDQREGHQEGPEHPVEQRVATIVSAAFMILVGLSMPPMFGQHQAPEAFAIQDPAATLSGSLPFPGWGPIAVHVLVLTVLINFGKMFPLLCYRREVRVKERLALSIGLWPRGEVGAGVLLLSLSYGIGGPLVTVGVLCLAMNLVLTGAFIGAVKKLLA
ncbi:MAG: sodium:proton antiporter [Planctomycetota bacterium]|nr:sodium:proton antiporter [Planctomycetota bacterium]